MEFLEGLLFCLMVNGISSNKYYYKRIGNGFDVIFGPHAIGDYKELKPPKSIKVNYDMRGERPGECIDGRFLCRIPYQRSMTEHFECISDYQCPRFHKCCQLKCFIHKVCQPAFGADLSTTIRSTSYKETSTSTETTQPPEPPPQVNLDTRTSTHPIKTTEVTSNESPPSEPSEKTKTSKITTREPVTNISQKITISSTTTSGETRKESSKESTKATAGITNKINEISSTVMTSNTEINTSTEAREQKTITITTRSPNIEYENMAEIRASLEIKDETTTGMVMNRTESPTTIEINTSTESLKPTIGQVTMEVLPIKELSATEITSTNMRKIDPKSTEITIVSPLVETETASNIEISVYKTSTELMKSTSSFSESSETTITGQPNTTEDTMGRPEPQTKSSAGTTESETTDIGSNTEITSNKFSEPESTAQTETSSKIEQQTSNEYAMEYSTTISSEYIQSTGVDILAKNVTTISAEIQIKKSDKTEMIENSNIRITYANETSSQKTVTSKGNTSTRETVYSTNFSPSTETSATMNINEPSAKLQGFSQNRTAHDMMESGFGSGDGSGNGSEDDTEAGVSDKSNKTPQKESEINKNATTTTETFEDDEDMMKSEFGSGDGSGDGSEDDTEAGGSDKPDKTSQKESELHKNATTMTETSEVGEDMMESGFGSGDGSGNGSEDDTEAVGSEKPDKTSQKGSALYKNATSIPETFEDDEDMMESGFGSGGGSGNGIEDDTKADGGDKPDKTSQKESELYKNATTKADTSKVDQDIMESGIGSGDGSDNGNKINTEAEDNDNSNKNPQKGMELDENATIMAEISKDDNDMMESGFVSGNGSKNDTEAVSIDRSDETFQKGLELDKNVTTNAESSEDDKPMMESEFGSGDGSGNGDDNTEATRSHKPNKTLQTSSELLKNTTEITTTSPETTESTTSFTDEGYGTKTDQFSKMVVDEKRKINISSTAPGDRSDEIIVTGSTNFTTSTGSDIPDKTPQEELEENAISTADAFEDGEDVIGSGFGGSDNSGNKSEDDTEVGGRDKPNKTPQKGSQLHENVRSRADTFEDGSDDGGEDNTEATESHKPNKTIQIIPEQLYNTTDINSTSPKVEVETSANTRNSSPTKIGDKTATGISMDQTQSPTTTNINTFKESIKQIANNNKTTVEITEILSVEESSANTTTTRSGDILVTGSTNFTKATGSDKPHFTLQNELELYKNATSTANTFKDDEDMMGSGFGSGDGSGNGSDDDTEAAGSDEPGRTHQKGWELLNNSTTREDEVII
nr:cell wall protein IFF6-like isoform X2 [Leptinotarsa decemlineata]